MGSSMAGYFKALAVLGAATLAGCQQGGPLRLSVAPDEQSRADHPTELKDTPYVNPDWQDDDSTSNQLGITLDETTTAVGGVFHPLFALPAQGIASLWGDKPSAAVQLLLDPASPDNRRIGMAKLTDFGFLTHESFVTRCRLMAEDDKDYTVRAAAIRMANRARDGKSVSCFIKGLGDESEWVRLESAKALANVPDVNAAPALIAIAQNVEENRDVRVAAVDALKHYRTLAVERALCSVLHDKHFAITWQARKSLQYLTSHDFGYDQVAWLSYFTGTDTKPG